MEAAEQRDYANLLYEATSFVRSTGRRGPDVDDLAQLMVLEALERPGLPFNLEMAYRHAVDALHPRHTEDGVKVRTFQSRRRPLSLDTPLGPDGGATLHDVLPAPVQATPWGEAPPLYGPVRAMALLYGQGYTLKEIGALFGVSESRVCQVFAEARRPTRRERRCQRCHTPLERPKRGARYCLACGPVPRVRREAPAGVEVDWSLRAAINWITF